MRIIEPAKALDSEKAEKIIKDSSAAGFHHQHPHNAGGNARNHVRKINRKLKHVLCPAHFINHHGNNYREKQTEKQ